MIRQVSCRFMVVLTLCLISRSEVLPQAAAAFVGTVHDPSAPGIPGALASILNAGRGWQSPVTADRPGWWCVPNLPVGIPSITVAKERPVMAVSRIERLQVGQESEQNLALQAADPPQYGIVISKDVKVAMRDGTKLVCDIYRPAGPDGNALPGRFPTILLRTSYDKNDSVSFVTPVAYVFTRRGYATVLQDLRGRQNSEGFGQYFHIANVNEGRDGYDTIEWIASQPWSNGRVGMVGSSHGGIVQTAASLERPPHLSAIWADVSPTSAFRLQAREGGAMALQTFGALFLHAHDAQEVRHNEPARRQLAEALENLRTLIFQMPFKPGHTPLAVVPNLEETLFRYYYGGEYSEFWSQECLDHAARFSRAADIPGVFSGGWYDPYAADTTDQFAAMARKNKSPQRLIMGPWTHAGMRGAGASYAGDVDFGPAAKWGDDVYNEHRIRWFDRWLKDVPSGVEEEPPVRIFVMGGGDGRRNREGHLNHGGGWRSEREWPLARTQHTTYYLRSAGRLAIEAPGKGEAPASYTHDPGDPVPTVSGNVVGLFEWVKPGEGMNMAYVPPRALMRSIVVQGGAHQKEEPGVVGAKPPFPLLSNRSDVLVFQTGPLDRDIEVTGSVEVKLWISSSALDTDFTAKLVDVYPPGDDYPAGYHLNIADSIRRARYRNGFERAELMEPGRTYEVPIPLPPISNLFKAGHRIRIDVASSNFPRFDVNPNTGEPLGRHTRVVKAHNTVYLDGTRPSRVILPVIPRN